MNYLDVQGLLKNKIQEHGLHGLHGLTQIFSALQKIDFLTPYYVMKHETITEKIIEAFYKVYNTLGYGFLERVYLNAMFIELKVMGFKVEMEKRIQVYYFGNIVGDYNADLIVEELVVVELKAIEALVEENEYQLINYLKATTLEVGLLLNFGKKPQVKRKIFDNDKKKMLKNK